MKKPGNRGPNKHQSPYTLQDMYKEYIAEFEEGSHFCVPYSEYKDIAVAYLKYLQEELVEKSAKLKLPFSLGHLMVSKKKQEAKKLTAMPIDWYESKKQGKQVRFFNDHSGGFKYSFFWSRKFCAVKNKNNYLFTPTRDNARRVAQLVKTKENDYFEN